ncbi:MAG: DUF2905 domain-containing protein [Opitutaceae bacterium]
MRFVPDGRKSRLPVHRANTRLRNAGNRENAGRLWRGHCRHRVRLWSGFGAGWLGRLPGDIRIERAHSAFYFPIVTCIILSIVVSLLLSFFPR